jgi:hypothetical protein
VCMVRCVGLLEGWCELMVDKGAGDDARDKW